MRRWFFCLTLILLIGALGLAASAEAEAPFTLSSRSAILMSADTGAILYAKDEHAVLPPASVTKLMVMLLAMEAVDEGRVKLTDTVIASPEACSKGGSQIWLEQGEQMTLADLMKAVSIVSANDASVAVAEHIAGSEESFVRLMNKRAAELGMKDTVYVNSTGLSPDDKSSKGNMTSAYDQALLAREMLKHPAVLNWTGTWIDYLRGGESFLRNTNNLVRFYEGCDGLKTGYTEEAGYCLVATAKRAGVRLIAVVMKASTSSVRSAEITKLMNYGFSRLKAVQVYKQGETVANIPVNLGESRFVPAVVASDLSLIVERDSTAIPKKDITLPAKVTAPVKKGTILGQVVVTLDGEERGRANLVAGADVVRSGFLKTLGRVLAEIWLSLFRRG